MDVKESHVKVKKAVLFNDLDSKSLLATSVSSSKYLELELY